MRLTYESTAFPLSSRHEIVEEEEEAGVAADTAVSLTAATVSRETVKTVRIDRNVLLSQREDK